MTRISKPTVVVFSCFYEPFISGAERFVKEVVERLANQYRFIIVTARLSRQAPKREVKQIGAHEYEICRVGFGVKIDKWCYPLLAPGAARRHQPKIVHAVMESYAGIALWFYRFFGGNAKTILTLQSGDLDDAKKQQKIPDGLWRKIHTTPDRVTAISAYLKDRAVRLGVAPNRVSIIPNGVDLKSVAAPRQPIARRIVSVARLSWEKGLAYLIAALPAIKKEFSDAHLVVVGGGLLAGELEKQACELGVIDAVVLLGNQPHERALAEISKAEVFITPSLAEGLGIVFIEAQAAGVPVIGTNVGGIPDIIKNEETGLLIPPRDSAAIAAAIVKIFKNKDRAEQLAKTAQKNLHRFDWTAIAGQVSDLYQSLV